MLKLVSAGYDITFLKRYYPLNYINSNINSLPSLSGLPDISLMHYIIYYELISLAGCVLLSIFVMSLSLLIENGIQSAIISTAVVFLPEALIILGGDVFSNISFSSMISPGRITDNISGYILCGSITMILLFNSKIKWEGNRHMSHKRTSDINNGKL